LRKGGSTQNRKTNPTLQVARADVRDWRIPGAALLSAQDNQGDSAMPRVTIATILLTLVAGCSNDKDPASPAPERAVEAAPKPSPTPGPDAPPKASAAIAVDSEGLRILVGAGEATRAIPFGTDEATVISAIEKLRGKAKRESNDECGAGAVQFAHFGGLSLLFQEGKFGGWSLQPAEAGGIGTMNGIAIGSRRAALNTAFPTVKIDPESTLGTEFYTGGNSDTGVSGLLDGTGPQAKITHLWSGLNCVFR
jgi:hypothetical protein